MRPLLPLLLTFNGGYVDAAGFLALQGLFTAHVTGNFVTLGASLALGTTGVLAKILALPTFCTSIVIARTLGHLLRRHDWPAMQTLLALQTVLLSAAATLAIRLGPFQDGDTLQALLTGMTLVAAMAVQSAVHRIHLSKTPPGTVMTGTTIQLMLDLADLLWGMPVEARPRLLQPLIQMLIFATACGVAALFYIRLSVFCFLLPPFLILAALATTRPTAPQSR